MPVKKVKGQFFEERVSYSDSAELFSDLLTGSEIPFEIKSFDDFVQTIFAKTMPQYNFNTWHIRRICLHPNVEIKTNKGTKSISQLTPGELVLTHRNRYSKVIKLISNYYYR